MFYAHFVLSKKGPLARIWLAAHWDKKLTKAHVFETNIEKSVEGILQPKVKLALRTSGHLLLGVVRIYSRKAKYLLADCNEAFVKIKMAFRPGMVDLPEESREAAVNAITLPEVFHDFDHDLNDLNDVDIQAQFAMNQSRAEEITMREDFGNLQVAAQFEADDNFSGNVGLESVEASELLRDENEGPGLELMDSDFGVSRATLKSSLDQSAALELPPTPAGPSHMEAPALDDGFGGAMLDSDMSGGLFEGGIFDDVPMELPHPSGAGLDETLIPSLEAEIAAAPEPAPAAQEIPKAPSVAPAMGGDSDEEDAYMDHFGEGGPPSVGTSRSPSPAPSVNAGVPAEEPGDMGPPPAPIGRQTRSSAAAAAAATSSSAASVAVADHTLAGEQTTLIQNEDESFALAPVDASALKGWPRTRRKRKLIVDEVKNISGEEMKAQLADTTDILTTLDLAPPTKRLMHWKETGGVEKLFTLSGRNIPGKGLFSTYTRNLISREIEDELPATAEEAMELPHVPGEEEEHPEVHEEEKEAEEEAAPQRKTRGRKRKTPEDAEQERQGLEEQFEQLQAEQAERATRSTRARTDQMRQEQEGSVPPIEEAPLFPEDAAPPMPEAVPQAPTDLLEDSVNQQIQPPIQSSMYMDMPDMPQPSMLMPGQPEMANMGWDGPADTALVAGLAPQSPFSMRTPGHMPMMTPGHDFDFPSSVGPIGGMDEPEELQATDETYEEYEERVLNRRAVQMHRLFKVKFDELDEDTAAPAHERRILFNTLLRNSNRKQVSQKFYTLLVLKKAKAIELDQDESFGPISITKGAEFDTCKL